MLENLQVRSSTLASDCIRLNQLTILTGKMQKKRFCAKLKNNIAFPQSEAFKRQPHKMAKHTQTICRQ